ncbi:MAG: cupin domain-containing protein [Clostridia bacterium]|nr:cupin domain-containing protein [Clostridia bacterium]
MKFRKFRFSGGREKYDSANASPINYWAGRERYRGGEASGAPINCKGDPVYDKGNAPIILDIIKEAEMNTDFRRVIWTGKNFQITLMSIPAGDDIGLEYHEGFDQLLYVASGEGEALMGKLPDRMTVHDKLSPGVVVVIPSGTYHNVISGSRRPLKLISVYAPKAHPFGRVDKTNPDKG